VVLRTLSPARARRRAVASRLTQMLGVTGSPFPKRSMLNVPHIPLRIKLSEGLGILRALGELTNETVGEEQCFRVNGVHFSVALFPEGDEVRSVWYDDPSGRTTVEGIARKIEEYLTRYGAIKNWELRMDNSWMRYWFNLIDKVSMIYGVHRDVLRFNTYAGDA
jgi:hypothetical protein